MSKVFCGECEFLLQATSCLSPENLGDTYLEEKGKQMQKPYDLNKNNNCKLYQEEQKKSK